MSRTLALLVLCLAMLTACTSLKPAQIDTTVPAEIVAYTSLQRWLEQLQQASEMPQTEVLEELVKLKKPTEPNELFYYAALNQQLETFASWANARDSFRLLQANEQLTPAQHQLAGILQQYNQSRINWYQRQSELLLDQQNLLETLSLAEQEKKVLETKIQALTDLEAAISTRKEQ